MNNMRTYHLEIGTALRLANSCTVKKWTWPLTVSWNTLELFCSLAQVEKWHDAIREGEGRMMSHWKLDLPHICKAHHCLSLQDK